MGVEDSKPGRMTLGKELWMYLCPGVWVHVRENVGMWEYVMMCISLGMFDYIWVLV